MLKYIYSQVYTKEIPDEVSLGISILGCPVHCLDCHSPYLWDINCQNNGIELTVNTLDNLISTQKLVSCVLFFGGEWNKGYLNKLLKHIKIKYKETLKTALYSGHSYKYVQNNINTSLLDYCKVGKYDKLLGGLACSSTNQRLYKFKDGSIKKDITSLFWK